MSGTNEKTKRLVINAMFVALCTVLGYQAIDAGSIKFTLESFPVMLGALLFGPADGAIIGGLGSLISQLLKYGVTLTTPLWILPYVVCGLVAGIFAKRRNFEMSRSYVLMLTVICELLITLINTGSLYLDSKIYGYYHPALIVGMLVPRFLVCIGKSLAFGLLMPGLLGVIRKVGKQ